MILSAILILIANLAQAGSPSNAMSGHVLANEKYRLTVLGVVPEFRLSQEEIFAGIVAKDEVLRDAYRAPQAENRRHPGILGLKLSWILFKETAKLLGYGR